MDTTVDLDPDDLRTRMVDQLAAGGAVRSARVEAALRAVPRHRFLPDVRAEQAYADDSVTTKAGPEGGRPLSCASQPTIVALMLDQLDVRAGARVLEIGAGTGYNAALLAELAGDEGEVTTVDVYPDVTARARQALDDTGYGRVRVVTGDGALGAPHDAPFDRIVVTVGPWDLPPAWADQLAPTGRLVVPLAWRGQTRTIAFVHANGHLRSESVELCGFIPMTGTGQDGEHTAAIDRDGHVTLAWDSDQPVDPTALATAMNEPGAPLWTGVTLGPNKPVDGIWLRLTATEPGTCRLTVDPATVETWPHRPAFPVRAPALIDGDSLAYLTIRRLDPPADDPEQRHWELGATGHGPTGPTLAQRLATQIHAWSTHRDTRPTITAHPADTPDTDLPATTIDKHHTRIAVTY